MMKTILAVAALALVSTAASAQTAAPAPAPAPVRSAGAHAGHEHAALPTIASSIKELLANPTTAAVLEKHLPGIGQHPARAQFEDMTLAQIAPFSNGMVTDAIVAAVDTDLKALPTHSH